MEHIFDKSYTFNSKTVIDCKTCGYKHLYPIPTPAELDEFYKMQYWNTEENKKTKVQFISTNDRIDDNEILNNRDFNNMFNVIDKEIVSTNEKKRMMDIGCGTSLVVYFFKLKSYETYFIEPNESAVDSLTQLGLSGSMSNFENFDFDSIGKFDFINLSFVLEHVINPTELIENVKKCLKPNGIVRISVPNDFSKSHLIYLNQCGGEAKWINYPDHVNYFNFDSLKSFIETKGFKEFYRSTSYPLDLLLIQGYDYYKNDELTVNISNMIDYFENNLIEDNTLNSYYESLANTGFGRSTVIYFKNTEMVL